MRRFPVTWPWWECCTSLLSWRQCRPRVPSRRVFGSTDQNLPPLSNVEYGGVTFAISVRGTSDWKPTWRNTEMETHKSEGRNSDCSSNVRLFSYDCYQYFRISNFFVRGVIVSMSCMIVILTKLSTTRDSMRSRLNPRYNLSGSKHQTFCFTEYSLMHVFRFHSI
jgi:hypothetical protein